MMCICIAAMMLQPNKHDVKKSLKHSDSPKSFLCGWKDLDVSQIGYRDGKPVMVVILEHFNMALYLPNSLNIHDCCA